jgi:hypothetical protein
MPITYKNIASATVGSGGAADIEFTSIPQTYDDLYILFSLRLTTSGYDSTPWAVGGLLLNGSPPSSAKQLFGTGSASGSDGNTAPIFTVDTNGTASTFSSGSVYLPNYKSTTNKSTSVDIVTENNGTAALQVLWAGLHTVTTAVTSVKLTADASGNFAQYSTATLYGIKKD